MATAARVLQQTWQRYRRNNCDLLGAGLAFYGLMAAAPLAWVSIYVASWALRGAEARTTLLEALRVAAGAGVARQAQDLLEAVHSVVSGASTWLVLVLLVWAASRFFVQLQTVLNVIWGATAESTPALVALRTLTAKRVLSFLMVLGCGGVLVVGALAHSILSGFSRHLAPLARALDLSLPFLLLQDVVLSVGILTLLLAGVYRVLPDVRIRWQDIWVGAVITALAIAAGTALLTLYLGRQGQTVTYEALGSIAAIALWVYYLSQVFVAGAAFTRAWAERQPARVAPEPTAQRPAPMRAREADTR